MTDIFYELYMMRGPSPETVYALREQSLTMGRDPLADILINDPEVSRQHALLISSPSGGFRIQDLGSTNGTFVDGKRLGSKPENLRPLNNITMGSAVTLVFRERGNIEQTELEGEDDKAQIIQNEAPDGDQVESASPSSAPEVDQSDPPKESGVEEPGTPAKQPSEQKSGAKPTYQQQQAVPKTGDDIPRPTQMGTDTSSELSPRLILGLVLLLLCCCLSIFLFIVYAGGDSLLRQLGVVP